MRVAELVRLSTEEQMGDGRVGLIRQKEENATTIKKNKLFLDHTIELIDVSGTSVLKTPEVQNLINQMRAGVIQGVVVADLDRLMRLDDFRDLAFLQEFIDNNVLIYLPDNTIDLNTQSGFLLGGIQSIISGNELTQIKKRMINAKEIKRRQGKHPNSDLSLPFGISYDRKNEIYYYNDDSILVKEIFDLFYYNSIHGYTDLEKITGIKHRTIYNLLQNKMFIGIREYKYKRSKVKNVTSNGRQGDKKKILRDHKDIISNEVIQTPLIEKHIFYNIQEIIKHNKREYNERRSVGQGRFLYSSALTCGICGDKIYTSVGKIEKKEYYCCKKKKISSIEKCKSNYLRKNIVDFNVTDFISNALTSKQFIKKVISFNCSEPIDSVENQLSSLDNKLHRLISQKDRLLDLYLDNIYSKEELTHKNSIIDDNINSLKHKIGKIKKKGLATDSIFLTWCLESLSRVLNGYLSLERAGKRILVREYFSEFVLIKQGIVSFTVNVCLIGKRLGVDADSVNMCNQLHSLQFKLPEPYLVKEELHSPEYDDLGLPTDQVYFSSRDISRILNVREDTFRARVRTSKYPQPKYRQGIHWRFTLDQVKEILKLTTALKGEGVIVR